MEGSADAILVRVTGGGVRNGYLSLRGHLDFFPSSSIGGSTEQVGGDPLSVDFDGVGEAQTDVNGPKQRFRNRSQTRAFIDHHDLAQGDLVEIRRVGEGRYTVTVREKGRGLEWRSLTSREAVLRAMAEYDELGREEFLERYGFGHAKQWKILHEGREYDQKAIYGVAWGFEHPDVGPLQTDDLTGGETSTIPQLRKLGFAVEASAASDATDVGSYWRHFFRQARRDLSNPDFDNMERLYKLEIAEALNEVLDLAESGGDWSTALRRAFQRKYGPVGFRSQYNLSRFNQHLWLYSLEGESAEELRQLFARFRESRDPVEWLSQFVELASRLADKGGAQPGSLLNVGSVLSMARDATKYPPMRTTTFKEAERDLGYAEPPDDVVGAYMHHLEFLDECKRRLDGDGVPVRDRLDVQCHLWWWRDRDEPPGPEEADVHPEPEYCEPPFQRILESVQAAGMKISEAELRRYHLSLKTRGFVILAGISGSGKTWLAELYAKAVGARHRLEAVAPNWTTNEDLLGYLNPLSRTFQQTSFTEFLRKAAAEWQAANEDKRDAVPFHVTLDEMNLARVEFYFAKFLSAMEVRARGEAVSLDLAPGHQVLLTPNLVFIGTVNVDETTHMFADKVYDRAQLVTLNPSREAIEAHLAGKPYQEALMEVWDAVTGVAPFAYRVLDEIAAYVGAATELGIDWTTALDEQLIQKVLPRLKGADQRVGSGLTDLAAATGTLFPLTYAKALEMKEEFERHGFASYF